MQKTRAIAIVTGMIFATTGAAGAQDFSGAAGLWTFDNAVDLGRASKGLALQLQGRAQPVSGPTAADGAVRIDSGSHFVCTPGLAANGSITTAYVNDYTLVFDVRVPALGKWYSLYQTNSANTDDGDVWIHTNGSLGSAALTYSPGALLPGQWTRLVLSVSNGKAYAMYADGQPFHAAAYQPLDGRYSFEAAPGKLLFFADNDGENNAMDVALAALYDRSLSASEVAALGGYARPVTPAANGWWRGNTHMHSTRSDGEVSVNVTSKWYHDNGYDFIVLTDHRVFTTDNDVSIPNRRPGFLVIQGEEFHSNTAYGNNHTTVVSASGALGDIASGSASLSEFFNRVHALATSKQGFPIINHPTWANLVPAAEFVKMTGMRHFELFNGSTDTDNFGIYGEGMPPIENLWDSVLSKGGKFYGVGSDDLHKFNARPDASNPMTGWTMVKAAKNAVPELVAAYRKGDFYATSGVMLKDMSKELGLYRVVIDKEATLRELARRDSARFTNPGRPVKTGTPGWRIEYFGPQGRLLKTETGDSAAFQVTNDLAYVRARITYLRPMAPNQAPYENKLGRVDSIKKWGSTLEEYHAWGQPYFTDTRREGPALVFGCMDPKYFEYEPAANVSQPGACKTPGTTVELPRRGDLADAGLTIRVGADLGDYALHIRSLDGRRLRTYAAVPARTHRIGDLARYGHYIVEIRGRHRTLAKKLQLR